MENFLNFLPKTMKMIVRVRTYISYINLHRDKQNIYLKYDFLRFFFSANIYRRQMDNICFIITNSLYHQGRMTTNNINNEI